MSIDVYITRTGAFLPLEPVSNDEMESVLGAVGGKPSKARRVVLRSNGIRHRHYAIDPATNEPVMSNAQLAAQAVRAMGDVSGVGCLAAATSHPDQLLPGHGVMVHGELGWPRLEVVSLAGVCVAGAAAFKHAWLSVKAGDSQRAVAVASEMPSPMLRGRNYEAEAEHKVRALEEYGLTITERVPLEVAPRSANRGYLQTKRSKFGHLLSLVGKGGEPDS